MSESISSKKSILKNDFFEGSNRFEFQEIVNYLQSLNRDLISLDSIEQHLPQMQTYLQNENLMNFTDFKTHIILNKHAKTNNEQLIIKEIYNFYLKSYFNHQKSKQLLTLNFLNNEEHLTKNFFIKVLNMDFSLESLFSSVREFEKTISSELIKLIESNLNFFK